MSTLPFGMHSVFLPDQEPLYADERVCRGVLCNGGTIRLVSDFGKKADGNLRNECRACMHHRNTYGERGLNILGNAKDYVAKNYTPSGAGRGRDNKRTLARDYERAMSACLLYVIAFRGGIVKVGLGGENRILNHISVGGTLIKTWESTRVGCWVAEQATVSHLTDLGLQKSPKVPYWWSGHTECFDITPSDMVALISSHEAWLSNRRRHRNRLKKWTKEFT